MADDIDLAQASEAEHRERALAGLRRALLPEESKGDGMCQDCEEPIAEGRLLVVPHAIRCTICQNIFDSKQQVRR